MNDAPHCDPAAPGGCSICGDEGVLARVLDVRPDARLATVVLLPPSALRPLPSEVALDLVDDIAPNDLVLVHQGFVISRVDGT